MKDFRRLSVWKKNRQFALDLYKTTGNFPREEKFGLVLQLRRASVSVSANLAEGCGRGSDADFSRFVQMAMGTASEVECELILSHDLGFICEQDYEKLDF